MPGCSSGAGQSAESSRSWLPLNMGFLNKGCKDKILEKLRYMGWKGLEVSTEYRYSRLSKTVYKVDSSAPPKFRDVLYFLGTEVEDHREFLVKGMRWGRDDEDEEVAPAVPVAASPHMRDRRTSSGSLGRLVRVLVAGPGEGETHFEDEIHDA